MNGSDNPTTGTGDPVSINRDRLINALRATLESENRLTARHGLLVNYWHEREASNCWVKPDWRAIAEVAVDDILFELGLELDDE